MRPEETLALAYMIPNEQRIEIPDAVVQGSRGQEFGKDYLAFKPHTRAPTSSDVNRLMRKPVERGL